MIHQWTLNFLLILTFIGKLAAIISGAGTLAVGLIKLIKPASIQANVEIYNIHFTSKLWQQSYLGYMLFLLITVFILASLAWGLNSLQRIIFNIKRHQYFSLHNLHSIQQILAVSINILLSEIIIQIYNKLHYFTVDLSSIWIMLVTTAFIYVIAQLFTRGLQLQTDSDYLI